MTRREKCALFSLDARQKEHSMKELRVVVSDEEFAELEHRAQVVGMP